MWFTGIAELASHLPSEIQEGTDLEPLRRLEAFVPEGAQAIGFECRLAHGSHAIDLGVALTRAQGGRGSLATLRHPEALRLAAEQHPRWQAIHDFGVLWHDPRSVVHAWVPFVFLEYDASEAARAVPVPSIFAALDSPLGDAESRGCPELAAAQQVGAALLAGSAQPAHAEQLELCWLSLRGESRVLHVAVMLGRAVRTIRLSVLLPIDRVRHYLESVGGCEAAAAAHEITRRLRSPRETLQLDFEIGPPVPGRVGVGLRADDPHSWREILAELVALGLADRDKAASLLRWQGHTSIAPGESAVRELSHIKLAYGPTGAIEAKAYLGATRARSPAPPESC